MYFSKLLFSKKKYIQANKFHYQFFWLIIGFLFLIYFFLDFKILSYMSHKRNWRKIFNLLIYILKFVHSFFKKKLINTFKTLLLISMQTKFLYIYSVFREGKMFSDLNALLVNLFGIFSRLDPLLDHQLVQIISLLLKFN